MIAEAGVEATLDFVVAGGRTGLRRQHVPYPFHVTRPFHLDPGRPDLATLYLQSASGGVYSGERLGLSVAMAKDAAAFVTTQSATIVHDCRGKPAALGVQLSLARGSLLAYAPDPLVLFPGAAVHTTLRVALGPGAMAVCQDGFACHDPGGQGAPFDHIRTETVIHGPDGALCLTDRGLVAGAMLGAVASPLGPYRAAGSVLLLGRLLEDGRALQARIDLLGCASGVSALPNGAGTGIRLLAPDGGRLSLALALASNACFRAVSGIDPAPRRK